MRVTVALFRRWLHCLTHFHTQVDVVDVKYIGGVPWRQVHHYIGCGCGEVFYRSGKPGADALIEKITTGRDRAK